MDSNSQPIPRWLTSVWAWAGFGALGTAVQCPFPVSFGPQWLLAAPFVLPFLAGLLGGVRGVIGILLGAAAVNFVVGTAPVPFAGAMVLVFVEAGLTTYLSRTGIPFERTLRAPRDVLLFGTVVVTVAAIRALATLAIALPLGSDAMTAALSAGCHTWFATVLAAPAFLVFTAVSPRLPSWGRVVEAVVLTVAVLGVNYRFFGHGATVMDAVPLPYLSVLAFLTCWVALRFETTGMAVLVLVSLFQMLGLSIFRGTWAPFFAAGTPAVTQAVVLLAFGVVVLSNLFVAAVAGARRRQDEEQRLLVAALQEKTQKLTALNDLLAVQTGRAEAQSVALLSTNAEVEGAYEKLTRQQAWVDAVLASMPVGVFLIDRREGRDGSERLVPLTSPAVSVIGRGSSLIEIDHEITVLKMDGTPMPVEDWPVVRAGRTGEKIVGEDIRVRGADGVLRTLTVNAAPIREPDGTVTGSVAVTVDVTERERAAAHARETDERLRFALNTARTIAWEREANGGMIRRTGSVADWLGLPLETGFDNLQTYSQHVHPDDRAEAERYFYDRVSRPGEFAFEYRMLRADGGVVWVVTRGEVLGDDAGRPIRIVGVHLDVTEQKEVEQKLRLLESAVEHARDAVVLLDANETPNAGRSVLYVNDAFVSMSGYAREEVVGRSLNVLRGPDSNPATLDEIRTALDAGQSLRAEILNYHKSGTAYWADLTLELVRDSAGRKSHWVMIQRDMTDRKRAEDALRRSEEMFRGIFENAWAGVSLTDPQGRFVSANPAFLAMLGWDETDLLGRHATDVTSASTWELQRPLIEDVLAGGRDRYQLRKEYVRADGSTFWGELFFNAIRGPGREFLYGLGVTVDVTERTRLEEQVRASEARLRALYENSAAGVIVVDPHSVIIEVNPAFAKMLGYEPAAMAGLTLRSLTHPDDVEAERAALEDLLSGRTEDARVRKRYRRADGAYVVADLYTQAVRDPRGDVRFRVGVVIDMTERVALEDQLRQAQKMEAIGQMAGGIAHDFNNLLTAVIGNLSLVRRGEGDPDGPLLDEAERAANRAADLTRKLLGYARRSQLVLGPVKLADVANEVVAILRRTLDPRVIIRADVGDCPAVVGDATLLNQVLFNLCLNSRDALPPGGGHIFVSLATVRADRPPTGVVAGDYARLSVADDGAGMSDETRAKIFEPFFTTKGVGKGTGLGLAMVLGIVQQHGGWVDCESHAGTGTRFDIYLPLVPTDAPGARRGLSRPALPAPSHPDDTPVEIDVSVGGETILLVDDEPMIRSLAKAVLEGGGYRVVEAEDGAEAVDWYRDHPREAGLVIMDLTMPRLSGRDAFRQIRSLDPLAKVLFSSGYSAEELTDVVGSLGMLAKPYRPADLLNSVRTAIVSLPPSENGQELPHLGE